MRGPAAATRNRRDAASARCRAPRSQPYLIPPSEPGCRGAAVHPLSEDRRRMGRWQAMSDPTGTVRPCPRSGRSSRARRVASRSRSGWDAVRAAASGGRSTRCEPPGAEAHDPVRRTRSARWRRLPTTSGASRPASRASTVCSAAASSRRPWPCSRASRASASRRCCSTSLAHLSEAGQACCLGVRVRSPTRRWRRAPGGSACPGDAISFAPGRDLANVIETARASPAVPARGRLDPDAPRHGRNADAGRRRLRSGCAPTRSSGWPRKRASRCSSPAM